MADQQEQPTSAFDGLDVKAAQAKAEQLREQEPPAEEMRGGYEPKRFRIRGRDDVFEETPAADVTAETVLEREDMGMTYFVPIVSVGAALDIDATLELSNPIPDRDPEMSGSMLYSTRLNDDQAVWVHVDDELNHAGHVFIDMPLKGDPEPDIILDMDVFEVVD